MGIFKAYKGHRKTVKQVSGIVAAHGDYYPIDDLLVEVPTDILIDWLIKNGFEPQHEAPAAINGVISETNYRERG